LGPIKYGFLWAMHWAIKGKWALEVIWTKKGIRHWFGLERNT